MQSKIIYLQNVQGSKQKHQKYQEIQDLEYPVNLIPNLTTGSKILYSVTFKD